MKAHSVFIFVLAVLALLGVLWYFYPAEGIKINHSLTLKFASRQRDLAGSVSSVPMGGLDVDSIIEEAQSSLELSKVDTAAIIIQYATLVEDRQNRLYLPDNNFDFFDGLFSAMDKAAEQGKLIRIMHYGDSQIEMDRISSTFREMLQQRFGGSGPGIMPPIQTIPSISIGQSFSGSLHRFTMYGSGERATHKRYGPMCQLAQLEGEGTISFRTSSNRYAEPGVKRISRVSVLLGNNSENFTATLVCDSLSPMPKAIDSLKSGVSLLTWRLPKDIAKGSIKFRGRAEIYAVILDGEDGVAVDNIGLRGCAGYIFSSIDRKMMKECFSLLDARLIMLQFGGNAAGGMNYTSSIVSYCDKIRQQIEYFRSLSPDAVIMFIGPSDMGKHYTDGSRTYPRLKELNDSLKAMCLRNNTAYWDLFNMMGGENSMSSWVNHNPPYAGPDYVHFTTKGATHVGQVLARSLLFYYDLYRYRSYGAPIAIDSSQTNELLSDSFTPAAPHVRAPVVVQDSTDRDFADSLPSIEVATDSSFAVMPEKEDSEELSAEGNIEDPMGQEEKL